MQLYDHILDNQTRSVADYLRRYNDLLNGAGAHISRAHGDTQATGIGISGSLGFTLSDESQSPNAAEDFDLVAWPVMPEEAAQ